MSNMQNGLPLKKWFSVRNIILVLGSGLLIFSFQNCSSRFQGLVSTNNSTDPSPGGSDDGLGNPPLVSKDVCTNPSWLVNPAGVIFSDSKTTIDHARRLVEGKNGRLFLESAGNGTFVSDDRGETWRHLKQLRGQLIKSRGQLFLFADEYYSNGTPFRSLYAYDGDCTLSTKPLLPVNDIEYVHYIFANEAAIIASIASKTNGVLRFVASNDLGVTWKPVDALNQLNETFSALNTFGDQAFRAQIPKTNNETWTDRKTSNGVDVVNAYSMDGLNWTPLRLMLPAGASGFSGNLDHIITVDSTQRKIYESTDRGITFTPLILPSFSGYLPWVSTEQYNNLPGNKLLVVFCESTNCNRAAIKDLANPSSDWQTTWTSTGIPFRVKTFEQTLFSNNQLFLVGIQPFRFDLSNSSLKTFEAHNWFLDNVSVNGSHILANFYPAISVLGNEYGVFYSSDSGTSWVNLGLPFVIVLATAYDNGTIYIYGSENTVAYTSNLGQTWSYSTRAAPGTSSTDNEFYVSGNTFTKALGSHKIAVSLDRGASWTNYSQIEGFIPSSQGQFFISQGAIYRTNDFNLANKSNLVYSIDPNCNVSQLKRNSRTVLFRLTCPNADDNNVLDGFVFAYDSTAGGFKQILSLKKSYPNLLDFSEDNSILLSTTDSYDELPVKYMTISLDDQLNTKETKTSKAAEEVLISAGLLGSSDFYVFYRSDFFGIVKKSDFLKLAF